MQEQALNFFVGLVEYGYRANKTDILTLLLFSEASQLNTDDVLRKAALSPQEKFTFFGTYGKTLLSKNRTASISPNVLEMARLYVQDFTLNGCYRPVLRDQLEFIRNHPYVFDALDQETQQRVTDWGLIEKLLFYQSNKLPARTNDYFRVIGEALYSLRLYAQKEFMDQFFLRTVNTILSDEETLHIAVESLSPFLINLSSEEVDKDYRELLHRLATFLGRYEALYQVYIPYITLSISYAAELKDAEKDNFIQPLFENLLKHIDRETFDALDRALKGKKEEIRKEWQHYSAVLCPLTVGERVDKVVDAVKIIIPKAAQVLPGKRVKGSGSKTPAKKSKTDGNVSSSG